jgi:hypothetical protein
MNERRTSETIESLTTETGKVLGRLVGIPLLLVTLAMAAPSSAGDPQIGSSPRKEPVAQETKPAPQPLTRDRLCAAQRTIAEIELQHLNLQTRNLARKPTREQLVPENALASRVDEPLRMSQALASLYAAPITASDLLAELEREATATKMPERLRELWAALGNDPALIAEAVARPILAENRLRARFSSDERIHGELRARILKELAGLEGPKELKSLSGAYREDDYRLLGPDELVLAAEDERSRGLVRFESKRWYSWIEDLGNRVRRPGSRNPSELAGAVGRLEEDTESFRLLAVLEAGPAHVRVASMTWRKTPFSVWWESVRSSYPATLPEPATDSSFSVLPDIPQKPMHQLEVWDPINTNGAPAAREAFACFFTGSEMLIWGGRTSVYAGSEVASGGRYNPTTDSWQATSEGAGCPVAQTVLNEQTAVWTGGELVIWNNDTLAGSRYNPGTNGWTVMSTAGAPSQRYGWTMVSAEGTVIVWGGYFSLNDLNTGGIYDPSTDSWSITGMLGDLPQKRHFHTATWDWSDNWMVVWGGLYGSTLLQDGGAYNGGVNWYTIPTSGPPSGRYNQTQVAYPSAGVLIWGGNSMGSGLLDTGGWLDKATFGAWHTMTTANAPTARQYHTAVWSYNGNQMIVWGGEFAGGALTNTGGRYAPWLDTWTALTTTGAPSPRVGHGAVEISNSGLQMIVWGGSTSRIAGQAWEQTGSVYTLCVTTTPVLQTTPVTAADLHSCTQGIRITWKDASDWLDSGYGTRSYDIYKNGALLATRSYGVTSYTDTATVAGTSYSYYVRYNNGCGHSTDSGVVSASDTITGSAPTGLTNNTVAPDGNLCDRNSLTVSWTRDPVAWNDSSDLISRRAYEILVDGTAVDMVPYLDNVTSQAIPVGTSNVAHVVSVRYRNGCEFSAATTGVSTTDYERTIPVMPTISAADANGCADTGVTITWPIDPTSWGDNGATTFPRLYDVYRGTSMIAPQLAYGTTSYTDAGGANGVSYDYAIRYTNACGMRATTATAAAADNLSSAPSTLTNNTATDVSVCADSGVTVTWTADAGSWGDNGTGTRSYTILRDGVALASGGCSGSIAYNTTICTDTTGTNGTAYTYSVRYNNGCSLNATTTGASATDVAPTSPTAPTNNTAADVSACGDTGVTVTWSADPSSWGDNGSGTRSYTILRGAAPLASGGCSGSLAYGTTTCTDATGTNGTAYNYSVRYNNGCGLNGATTGVLATDNVSAAPSSLTNNTAADVSVCADSGVTISWTANAGNWGDNGSGTRTYTVLRGGTPVSGSIAYGTTTYTDTTGTNGTAYTYSVRYNNGCGLNAATTGVSATDNVGAAPSSLTNNTAADLSACADTGVTINWAAPGNWGDSGFGVRSIDVLRGGTPIVTGLSATATSYTDGGGTNGTSYTYTVRFNNGCGLNAATTGASAVDNVGAAPSSLTNNTAADVAACADSGVTVTWVAPGSWGDNNSGTRTIDVLRAGTAIATGLSSTTTTYTDTTGTNGTAYTYTVRFNNGCSLNATTTGASATDSVGVVPTGVTNNGAADVSACADSGVTVSWVAPGNWGDNNSGTRTIDVLRGGTAIASALSSTTTTYTDTTGTNGTAYSYTVRFNNGCSLNATTTGALATDVVPTAPSSLPSSSATDLSVCADTGVGVSWAKDAGSWGDNGNGTRSYAVYRNGGAIPSGGCSGSLAYGTTTCTDTTGTNGTSYTYSVRYVNGCSLTANTSNVSATDAVDTTACSAVGNTLSIGDSGTNVSVGWAAVSCGDLANYRVYGATAYDATFPSAWTLLGQPTGTSVSDTYGSAYVAYRIVSVDACGNASTN